MQVRALQGRVVTPDHIIDDGAVVLSGSHIAWVGPADQAARAGFGDVVEQAQTAPEGGYLLPGLVDVHCHGGGGESFPNAESAEQAMVSVLEHRRFGTTSLVASCVTAAPTSCARAPGSWRGCARTASSRHPLRGALRLRRALRRPGPHLHHRSRRRPDP